MNTETAPKKRGWPLGKKRGPKKVDVVVSAPAKPVVPPLQSAEKPHVKFSGMGAKIGVEDELLLQVPSDLIPDGMDLMWVTDSVLGQPVPHERAKFERGGWEPITMSDFDGHLGRHFMPKGTPKDAEINMQGVVLMARPLELSKHSRALEYQKARGQVRIKEQQITGGDINTPLDSRHPSALRTNRITKTVERLEIPEK